MAVGLSVVSQVGWANVLLCAHRLLGLLGDEKDGEYRSYHFDYRGSTVVITDQTGKVVERFQYGPYGELVKGDASVTPFLFNGKYGVMTDSNGLYYMRARYYSSEIKRFVNQDILLGNIAEGQTLNRFAYVTGNPIKYTDPYGLLPTPNADGGLLGGCSDAQFYHQIRNWHQYCPPREPENLEVFQCPEFDWKWEKDNRGAHGENTNSYRGKGRDNIGYQCVYYSNGDLVTDPRIAGSYDYFPPTGITGFINHLLYDVWPVYAYGTCVNHNPF